MKRLELIACLFGFSCLAAGCGPKSGDQTSSGDEAMPPTTVAKSGSSAETGNKRQVQAEKRKQGLEMLPPAAYVYPKAGVTIGQGWDTYNEVGTPGTCVDVAPVPLETTSFKTDIRQAQSSVSTLAERTLAVRASYSGTGGKASASVSSESSRSLNVDALNFAMTFESENGSTFAVPPGVYDQVIVEPLRLAKEYRPAMASDGGAPKPPSAGASSAVVSRAIEFTPAAKDMLRLKQYDKFAALCGQGFVMSIHRGAKVDIVLSMMSSKSEDRDALASAMSASGYGASGSVRLTTNNKKAVSNASIGYRTYQEGGLPHIPKDISDGILKITDLAPSASTMLSNPTAYRVMVVPYENLDPSIKGELTTPLRLLSIGSYYLALKDIYNLVDSIVENNRRTFEAAENKPKPYISSAALAAYGGKERLVELKDMIQIDMAVLEYAINECAARKTTCLVADSFEGIKQDLDEDKKTIDGAVAVASAKNESAERRLNALQTLIDKSTIRTEVFPNIFVGGARKGIFAALADATRPPGKTDSAQDMARKALDEQYEKLLSNQAKAFEKFRDIVVRLQQDLADVDVTESLPDTFYLRFYWYLAQIPPAQTAESDYFTADDFKITGTPTPGEIVAKAGSAREKIINAAMNTRILPWKRYFCDDLKQDALCVTDAALEDFMRESRVSVSADKIAVEAPHNFPASGKRCKSKILGKKFACWRL